ncbi:hypothetical protein F945_01957 [Acinetobacter rudis CIP 110305]|uniref:Uncharacterized protein n=4 Tax=Acinetobacter rudis TaxID=632955 RepID=S3N5Q1_9GAMM|nr:hypothetical protein F945_01957 [Acinetobacter rudis CIP 110305]
MMESLNSRFDGVSLTATGAAFLIGGILWVFYYFFNFRIKDTLKAISDGLLGTFIALFRLAGGILFAFAFLYLIVDGFAGVLLGFVYYGVVSIMNSTFLIILKNKMFLRPKR